MSPRGLFTNHDIEFSPYSLPVNREVNKPDVFLQKRSGATAGDGADGVSINLCRVVIPGDSAVYHFKTNENTLQTGSLLLNERISSYEIAFL